MRGPTIFKDGLHRGPGDEASLFPNPTRAGDEAILSLGFTVQLCSSSPHAQELGARPRLSIELSLLTGRSSFVLSESSTLKSREIT